MTSAPERAANCISSMSYQVKIVMTVPETHADAVREAMGKAGAGRIGNYEYCSFSNKGVGRFRPLDGAHPTMGSVGEMEHVVEERIEVSCLHEIVQDVVAAIRSAHPYEEPVIDTYQLI